MISDALSQTLLKPIIRNERTLLYQETLDSWVDELRKHWCLERGLIGSRNVKLPHEEEPGYWELDEENRLNHCSPEARQIYTQSAGRDGTGPLCIAAFCWHSPLSRHHSDPQLLAFFAAGLRFYAGSIRHDGLMASKGLNGEGWAHGWDVEGLVYGLIFCGKALPQELRQWALERFRLSAHRHANLPQTPAVIGSCGNQRCVWILGLYLYGQLLDQPELISQADRFWDDAKTKVLDDSGQVIEQLGPCMHYSYTGFFYAWLNLVIRGDASEQVRIERCLDWFRYRHTESLYPVAGPSTRIYRETITPVVYDLLPATEQLSSGNPQVMEFVTRLASKARRMYPMLPPTGARREHMGVCGHGASPLMWAILMSQEASTTPPAADLKPLSVTHEYRTLNFLKHSPLPYLLVRREYQTHFNYADFLPFSGIQTWALGNEPPIIHPTPLAPSTTQGDSLDTARQGVSHNWGLYGAGAIGIDAYCSHLTEPGRLSFVLARYAWLWRLAIFTNQSTVILEFGNGGPRRTLWTLNRVEPATPAIGNSVVTFTNRRACLHASPGLRPRLETLTGDDPWAKGVHQLRYDCGGNPAAFAFSDASFTFDSPPPGDTAPWQFSDRGGHYEVVLDRRLFLPNPGNFRVDTFHLANGIIARQH